MTFWDSYKRLANLCRDVLGDSRGVSAYIEAMDREKNASIHISNWNSDLKMLFHYRSIRNSIAHKEGANEQELCSEKDVEWLENFRLRILNQTDPLAMFEKHKSFHHKNPKTENNKEISLPQKQFQSQSRHKSTHKSPSFGKVALLLYGMLVFSLLLIYILLKQS